MGAPTLAFCRHAHADWPANHHMTITAELKMTFEKFGLCPHKFMLLILKLQLATGGKSIYYGTNITCYIVHDCGV